MASIDRWLSWLWPITAKRVEGRFGPLEARWESGELVVNSAHGNQSFGSLHRVWQQVIDHIAQPSEPFRSVLMLGVGAGSIVRILRSERGSQAPITLVDIDPAMIDLGKTYFGLDQHADIELVMADAILHVHTDHRRYDLVLVDLFEDLDLARGVETMGFAHALRDRCGGTLCFNTVAYDDRSGQRCQRVRDNLTRVFNTVDEIVLERVNRVFIAR